MERIKVNLPEKFSFVANLQIRVTDLNYGNHVGNDTYLSLAHEARMQFLMQAGYTELNLEGAGVIMVDSAIEYRKELNYPGEIRVWVAASGFDKIGFDIYYLLELKAADVWVTAAKIKTGMLCYDYTLKKKIAVPDQAIKKLAAIS